MGQTYLNDTNIIIDALDGKMPSDVMQKVNLTLPSVSTITYIEALGWYQITAAQIQNIQSFMKRAIIIPIDEPVVETAIRIRQQRRIRLGDAIIAATAIVNNMVLVTRNVDDFKSIDDLMVYNPWKEYE
jgi:predicted nucleic acid-binding protein